MNAWLAKPIPYSLVYCGPTLLFATQFVTGPNPWRAIATMGLCDIAFHTGFSQRTIDQF
jgi:hypothetical protein